MKTTIQHARFDSSFMTEQRSIFESGAVKEIGPFAYAVWGAIKYFASYKTGQARPTTRAIAAELGITQMTVLKAIKTLEKANLLRTDKPKKPGHSTTYTAREKLGLQIGTRTVCTFVIDYVPERMRGQIRQIHDAINNGDMANEVFAEIEIIPGDGLTWDPISKSLKGRMLASEMPAVEDEQEHLREIGRQRLEQLQLDKLPKQTR